jgi:hypothetical protein
MDEYWPKMHENDAIMHENDGKMHDNDGKMHENDGNVHEDDGNMHENDGNMHGDDGEVHLPRLSESDYYTGWSPVGDVTFDKALGVRGCGCEPSTQSLSSYQGVVPLSRLAQYVQSLSCARSVCLVFYYYWSNCCWSYSLGVPDGGWMWLWWGGDPQCSPTSRYQCSRCVQARLSVYTRVLRLSDDWTDGKMHENDGNVHEDDGNMKTMERARPFVEARRRRECLFLLSAVEIGVQEAGSTQTV